MHNSRCASHRETSYIFFKKFSIFLAFLSFFTYYFSVLLLSFFHSHRSFGFIVLTFFSPFFQRTFKIFPIILCSFLFIPVIVRNPRYLLQTALQFPMLLPYRFPRPPPFPFPMPHLFPQISFPVLNRLSSLQNREARLHRYTRLQRMPEED